MAIMISPTQQVALGKGEDRQHRIISYQRAIILEDQVN